jgi:uncharacterized protein (TIGR02145 family)
LDLSDVSGNKLGLLYPNVSLLATTVFGLDGVPVDAEEQAAYLLAARGMVVFNTNENVGQGEGIYLWNGREWSRMGLVLADSDLVPPTYPLTGFTLPSTLSYPAGIGGTVTASDWAPGNADYPSVKFTIDNKSTGASMYYASSSNCVVFGGVGDQITVRATSVDGSGISKTCTVTFVDPKTVDYATTVVAGLTFLTYNLGAVPTAYTSAGLSPATYTTSSATGDPAVGNLNGDYYQWGRTSDGHQHWDSKKVSAPVLSTGDYDATGQIRAGADAYGKFILTTDAPNDWRTTNNWLWDSDTPNSISASYVPVKVVGSDPCPTGFRVPTCGEWVLMIGGDPNYPTNPITPANDPFARGGNPAGTDFGALAGLVYETNKNFFLPLAGMRTRATGAVAGPGVTAQYWASTVNGANARLFYGDRNGSTTNSGYNRAQGLPVRCVAE